MSRGFILVTAATITLAGCGGGTTTERTTTKSSSATSLFGTSTTAPTKSPEDKPQSDPLKSKLIDLTFPAGSANKSDPAYPDIETWTVPLSQLETATYLNENLPIGRLAAGIPWCSQNTNTKTNNGHWDWSDANKWIAVDMMGGNVVIATGENDGSESIGRDGCDNEANGSSSGFTAKQDEYMALLTKWANRDGYAVGDRKTLIEAGEEVCNLIAGGESNISASASLMDTYGVTGKQAQSVGVAAAQTLCP